MKELTIPTIEHALEKLNPDTFFHKHSNLYVTHMVNRNLAKHSGLGKTCDQSRKRWYERNFIENPDSKNAKPDPLEAIGISNKSQPEKDLI